MFLVACFCTLGMVFFFIFSFFISVYSLLLKFQASFFMFLLWFFSSPYLLFTLTLDIQPINPTKHTVNETSPKTFKILSRSGASVSWPSWFCVVIHSSSLLLLLVFMSEIFLSCWRAEDGQRWTRSMSPSFALRSSCCSGWFPNSVLVIEMFLETLPTHKATEIAFSFFKWWIWVENLRKTHHPHILSTRWIYEWHLKMRMCFLFWSHCFLMMNLC